MLKKGKQFLPLIRHKKCNNFFSYCFSYIIETRVLIQCYCLFCLQKVNIPKLRLRYTAINRYLTTFLQNLYTVQFGALVSLRKYILPETMIFKCAMWINYLIVTVWSWSYSIWNYNYKCNQWLSPLTLWIRVPLIARCTRYIILW
jgi:hypothetical protein